MRPLLQRAIDLVVSGLALAVTCPLLAVAAIAIVWESAGSPFYCATRVGEAGRPFRMWKFRTMVTGAAAMGPAITGSGDARITRLGAILRKSKLDELPQFFNVLKGDMTLVGPRPETPEIVRQYSPGQRRVLDVKPGITGQVQLDSGEESESIPEGVNAEAFYVEHLLDRKVSADLAYLEQRTLWTDAQVMLSTVSYVLKAAGSLVFAMKRHGSNA